MMIATGLQVCPPDIAITIVMCILLDSIKATQLVDMYLLTGKHHDMMTNGKLPHSELLTAIVVLLLRTDRMEHPHSEPTVSVELRMLATASWEGINTAQDPSHEPQERNPEWKSLRTVHLAVSLETR